MGVKLMEFYAEASRLGGIPARVELATITRVNSISAAQVEDTAELVLKFQAALQTLKQGLAGSPASTPVRPTAASTVQQTDDVARYRAVIDTLKHSASRYTFSQMAREVTETVSKLLDVARVSVWRYDKATEAIICIDLYEAQARKHSNGLVLKGSDFPPYFKAMRYARAMDIYDAQTDPRTECFTESYLRPLNIVSMLDIPIRASDQFLGVICHEQVATKRRWKYQEADLGVSLAELLGAAYNSDVS